VRYALYDDRASAAADSLAAASHGFLDLGRLVSAPAATLRLGSAPAAGFVFAGDLGSGLASESVVVGLADGHGIRRPSAGTASSATVTLTGENPGQRLLLLAASAHGRPSDRESPRTHLVPYGPPGEQRVPRPDDEPAAGIDAAAGSSKTQRASMGSSDAPALAAGPVSEARETGHPTRGLVVYMVFVGGLITTAYRRARRQGQPAPAISWPSQSGQLAARDLFFERLSCR
jgi:hypothetical protein